MEFLWRHRCQKSQERLQMSEQSSCSNFVVSSAVKIIESFLKRLSELEKPIIWFKLLQLSSLCTNFSAKEPSLKPKCPAQLRARLRTLNHAGSTPSRRTSCHTGSTPVCGWPGFWPSSSPSTTSFHSSRSQPTPSRPTTRHWWPTLLPRHCGCTRGFRLCRWTGSSLPGSFSKILLTTS